MPPLRVERINDNGRHPNKFISFIKEDRRTTTKDEQGRAIGVLNRIAAIVFPIMKENGLQITTLEEHPFNDSYAGINYDAGDCIGLVLRTARKGWVPENFVLSVMLHELSHCTNMHHAGPFWKTLSVYRIRMSQLREKGYTGEGFWRQGVILGTGDTASLATEQSTLPKAICGGAYKGSRFPRRRKARAASGPRVKKVKPGEKLGGDLELRKQLDGGKSKATPRVVKSKRGQDLRAAAAELRFSAQLSEQFTTTKDSDSDEYEDIPDAKPKWKYEDEDESTQILLHDELLSMRQSVLDFKPVKAEKLTDPNPHMASAFPIAASPQSPPKKVVKASEVIDLSDSTCESSDESQHAEALPGVVNEIDKGGPRPSDALDLSPNVPRAIDGEVCDPDGSVCPICTFSSARSALFCEGCGTMKDGSDSAWQCQSLDCRSVGYLNHIDSALCGLCGSRRK